MQHKILVLSLEIFYLWSRLWIYKTLNTPYNVILHDLFNAASLSALFKHVESIDETTDENIREKVLAFIRDKVIF